MCVTPPGHPSNISPPYQGKAAGVAGGLEGEVTNMLLGVGQVLEVGPWCRLDNTQRR